MKEYLNKKNKTLGFTLIELLAVIVIISIIAVIMFQSITNKISDSKEKAYNLQINNIKTAAKKYILENSIDDKYHLNTICITISALQKKGYLEKGNIKNPQTDEILDVNKNYVKIKYNLEKNQYDYDFTDVCVSNIVEPASETIISNSNIKITNKEDGLYEMADSYIYKGLNPNNYIKINNNIWRIVSIDKETMMMKIINLNGTQKQISDGGIIKDLNDDFENGTTYDNIKEYVNLNSKWNSGIVNELDSAQTLKSIEKQKNTFNTIGLLTVGEYVDASLDKNCYNKNNCISYLSKSSNYWLLSNTSDNKIWYVSSENKLNYSSLTNQLYNIYPCLYLKLDMIIDSKSTGTLENPYILK